MRARETGPSHSRWAWGVPIVALTLVVLTTLMDPLPLRLIRNAAFDQYQRWHPRTYDAPPVRIVDIDDESLRRIGQWPWPRTRVAELVADIQRLEPASIALDSLFPEPDETSPRTLLQDKGMPDSIVHYLQGLPDHDDVLAQTLARGNVAIGFALTPGRALSTAEIAPDIQLHLKPGYVTVGGDPTDFVHAFASSVVSLERLQRGASGQGAITFIPDSDGIVRTVPLLMSLEGRLVPSLAAEAMRLAEHVPNYIVHSAANDGGIIDVQVGRQRIETDAHGSMWVHYSAPQPGRYVPAWKVMEHAVLRDEFKGRIVLVGTSAQGLMDLRFSPRGGIIPGVEIHAQALEQVLTHHQLNRPGWAPAAELLVTVFGGLGIAIIAMVCGAAWSTLGFMAIAGAFCAVAWTGFVHAQLLIDSATPTLALASVFVPTTIVRHLLSERRQRWVKGAFARYVSPNLVDYLIAHPGALELGGKRQRCSFVFADLQGFTTLMETLDPAKAVSLLNTYLDRMIAIAFENEGTLDRIVGDSVAIVFSAPIEQPDHERRALRCALQMQAFARAYVDDLKRQDVRFCETRIGVHTGEVIVGNFGGGTIFDYRALGDPVNTASRLEGANKYLGTLICVSEATLAGCEGAVARPVGRLLLAGKAEPVMVYEPLEAPDPEYLQAFQSLQAGRSDAPAVFEALEKLRPTDPLARLHASRLRAGETGDLIDLTRK